MCMLSIFVYYVDSSYEYLVASFAVYYTCLILILLHSFITLPYPGLCDNINNKSTVENTLSDDLKVIIM